MMKGLASTGLGVLILIAAPAAAADDGKLAFNNHCRTCHSMREGDNRLGPTLHGVFGRKAGTVDGFPFSSAMINADLKWTEATLDAFIENPDAVVRGHGMTPYGGINDPEKRARIIAYLAGS